jgi:hypothetical protein
MLPIPDPGFVFTDHGSRLDRLVEVLRYDIAPETRPHRHEEAGYAGMATQLDATRLPNP